MKRRWLTLAAVAVALWAVSAAAGAADDSWRHFATAPQLRGIKDNLGGLLAIAGVVLLGLGGVSLVLLAAALSPERVARAEQALRRGRWIAMLLGLVSTTSLLLLAWLVGLLVKAGAKVFAVAVLLILGFLVWLAVVGLAGMARVVGRGLLGDGDGRGSSWRVVGIGGLVIAGSLAVPFFGWAYFLYAVCRGIGAATLTLFSAGAAAGPVVVLGAAPGAAALPADAVPTEPGA